MLKHYALASFIIVCLKITFNILWFEVNLKIDSFFNLRIPNMEKIVLTILILLFYFKLCVL